MAQDYFINESIFLEDVYMRKNLTVTGILSALNFSFPGLDALSGNWQNTYLTVSALSASWGTDNAYDLAVRALTANWQNTYTTVSSFSASWGDDNSIDTGVRAITGDWQNTFTTVNTYSANWQNTYTTVSSYSASWGMDNTNGKYLPLSGGTLTGDLTVAGDISASGSYFGDGSNLTGLVGHYTHYVYNTNNGEYKLAAAYAGALADSVSDKVYFQVLDTTLTLDGVSYEIVDNMPSTLRRAISAAEASSYDTVNWQNTYTTVSSYSASWGNNVSEPLTAVDVIFQTNSNYTALPEHSGKILHFDTTVGPLTAFFNEPLPEGFNLGVVVRANNPVTIKSTNSTILSQGDTLLFFLDKAFVYREPVSNSLIALGDLV
jgi:hypothetical protein